jgi:hypothetical protein
MRLEKGNNFVFEQKLFFLMKTMNVSAKRISQTRCSLTEPLYFYQLRSVPGRLPVLWIRIGFTVNPDLAFYHNADPDPGSQTNADPDPGQTFKSRKADIFLHEKYTCSR